MSDQVPTTSTTPASGSSPTKDANMVPQSRLNEVIEERHKLEERLAQLEANQKAETEKQLQEQSRFKELSEQRAAELAKLQPVAAKVESYEKTLADVLAAQVAALPEDRRDLVPEELTTQQKLSWLAKNAAILKAPAPFDIGAGKHGGGETQKSPVLSPEEKMVAQAAGMTEEEYAKYR